MCVLFGSLHSRCGFGGWRAGWGASFPNPAILSCYCLIVDFWGFAYMHAYKIHYKCDPLPSIVPGP